jgi:hypothetical protein
MVVKPSETQVINLTLNLFPPSCPDDEEEEEDDEDDTSEDTIVIDGHTYIFLAALRLVSGR